MGDTNGLDVGNCTADDVYLSAVFDPVEVRLAATTASTDSVTLSPEVWTRLADALRTTPPTSSSATTPAGRWSPSAVHRR
jgi:hypothetical protein